jgi:hypothetical protein
MKATELHTGQEVYVVDDGLDPVVQKGEITRNLRQYPSNVQVSLPSRDTTVGCHPDQLLPVDAGPDEVDDFLDVRDRNKPQKA